jgi:hypothetical protein
LRDAPATQVRYTFKSTRQVGYGDHELFVLATNSVGVKSHPTYDGLAQRWDARELSEMYYPITIKIRN